LSKKPLSDVKAVICGAGTAGNAITKMLVRQGVRDIVVCDSKGILSASRISEFEEDKLELLELTNKDNLTGNIMAAVKDRDLFIGVSKPGALTEVLIRAMAKDPVIFALANPDPEIMPEKAKAAGARFVVTGSPCFANHISSALIFPGIFRGALDAEAREINDKMVFAAIRALAQLVPDDKLSEDCLLPSLFEDNVSAQVAKVVAENSK
jgi:malate dehydrogenase (oxaloacetate-decarboxylating)